MVELKNRKGPTNFGGKNDSTATVLNLTNEHLPPPLQGGWCGRVSSTNMHTGHVTLFWPASLGAPGTPHQPDLVQTGLRSARKQAQLQLWGFIEELVVVSSVPTDRILSPRPPVSLRYSSCVNSALLKLIS